MKKFRFILVGFVLAGLAGLGIFHSDANAASGPTGITVSPAFQQVSINPDESKTPIQFSVTNNENQSRTLNLSAADFNTLNESGGLLFVGTQPTELQKKYGLAKWIDLPESRITLLPKQTSKINVNILNLPDMPAGGHYGALMLSIAGSSSSSGSNNVAIHPIASSLLFVTKLGGDTHLLKLSDISIEHSLLSLPSSVTLRFRNEGNTHLIPRGTVTLTDHNGKSVSHGVINGSSGIILPETYRRYYVALQQVSSARMPGKYKLVVNFRFDGIDQYRTYQTSLFVIGPLGFAVIGLIIAIVLAGGYWLFKKRVQLRALRKELQKQWQTMYARISFVRPMKKKIKKKIPVKAEDE